MAEPEELNPEPVCILWFDKNEKEMGRVYSMNLMFVEPTFDERSASAHKFFEESGFLMFPEAEYAILFQDDDELYIHELVYRDPAKNEAVRGR